MVIGHLLNNCRIPTSYYDHTSTILGFELRQMVTKDRIDEVADALDRMIKSL